MFPQIGDVVLVGDLHVPRAWNVLSEISTVPGSQIPIACAMDDQGRDAPGREDLADVAVEDDVEHRRCHSWAGGTAFKAPDPLMEQLVVGGARGEEVDSARVAAPIVARGKGEAGERLVSGAHLRERWR